ncbi:hypothetical protein [Ottowia testudinis]|uniref:N-acetyltransferase domain-containing protein n=1 Tax=Ottowia testudinis TaxID=2816950 RepID=A0A975CGH7_9BURK|nr:hypothetical protein [Ottowia testudinis]QTD45775.1 hypothetical protein J1M35_02315 [Ottowia testudinis]
MPRHTFPPATPQDDAALRARMAADWMRGPLSVSFRREPNYFAGSALQGEAPQVHVCRDTASGAVVGMAARLMARCWVNGDAQRVGLLSDLRLAPEARGGTLLARGFKVLRQLHAADPVPLYLTAIVEGNQAALRSIATGRAGLPTYRDLGRMLTPAIHLDFERPALAVPGVAFRRATAQDAGALAELHRAAAPHRQFSRVIDVDALPPGLRITDFFVAERGSQLLAAIAAWDQHALRQTHIEAYTPWLAALRPLYNLAAQALPIKPLPAPGERIPYLYLSHALARGDDLAVWRGLLRHAYRALRTGPWHYAICSLHERDPLAAALRDYRRIGAAGRIFAVHYPEDAPAADALDARVPYVDMARL